MILFCPKLIFLAFSRIPIKDGPFARLGNSFGRFLDAIVYAIANSNNVSETRVRQVKNQMSRAVIYGTGAVDVLSDSN